ncbi:MAG: hypothetical protein KA314_30300 [Chloroflexi bacterium]|nr:hypothetical protein [Chloroflexota bacterium]MBP8060152.1 hypothetical protein [Chloroflexota bacterium]
MNENKSQMTPIATDAPFLMNALSHPAYGLGKDLVRAVAAVRWFWVPFLAFVITRLAIIGVAYLALPFIQDASDTVYHLRGTDNFFVDAFGSRWDTGFYVSIAEEGYIADGVRFPNVPFFPLLPLMMRALTPLVGDTVVAGLLITNLALLGATILLHVWVKDEWGEAIASRAVWYFLIFPAAFFGTALYSESLFLLCALGAVVLARRGYWESAALLGFAAALSRLMGVSVAILLALEWWQQWRQAGSQVKWWGIAAAAAPVLGLTSYLAYLFLAFDDPFIFARASAEAWGRTPQSPFTTIAVLFQTPAQGWNQALLAGQLPLNDYIDMGFVLLFLGLATLLLYRGRWGEGLFVLAGVIVPFSSGLLMSQRRYMWILFPVFVLLAQWGEKYPWLDRLITTLSLIGLALFTALFANGYWVG